MNCPNCGMPITGANPNCEQCGYDVLSFLQVQNNSAKGKMIAGIVLTSVGYVFLIAAIVLLGSAISFLLMFGCLGPGIPLLILGITGKVKAHRRIKMITNADYMRRVYGAPQYGAPQYGAPQQAAPQYAAPQQGAPVNFAPPAAPEAPVYEAPAAEAPVMTEAPADNGNFGAEDNFAGQQAPGAAPFDWRIYAPLNTGVSMNYSKDYKFHRAEGFVGSAPQSFINRTFIKCPLCCSDNPYWNISQHNQMSMKGNLYLFRCSCCGGVISMSMPDVTTLSSGGAGIASNPSIALTNVLVKKHDGKEPGVIYAVVETPGGSGMDPEIAGKEFKLEDLQRMSLR